MDSSELKAEVLLTARMMARAGLAEAFGHVSVRHEGGFVITSVAPFIFQTPDDLIEVQDIGSPPSGGGRAPIETPMHAAVYAARPDVVAICRGHPRSVVAWGVGLDDLPLLHGLGALAGDNVRVHPDVDLISTQEQAHAVAGTLGIDHSVILRANGCLAVGGDLLEALTRLYFLEERSRVAVAVGEEAGTTDWGHRMRHSGPELDRAKAWVAATFGDVV